ncbi:MAG: hypothetical protein HY323_04845 [Betaproteobacteria bacterium]|nr:hypothetical protein [Betaproteobacteria bacterium]
MGAAARGRPRQYQKEIAAVLPASLRNAVFRFDLGDSDDDWSDGIEDCDAVILTSRGLGRRAIQRAKRLRFVQKLGIASERVDIAACRDRGIKVSVLSDAGHVAVAEHTIMMMLAAARSLLATHHAVARGDNPLNLRPIRTTQIQRYPNWLGLPESDFPLLCDLTLGLIGFGEIAREVAARTRSLGMQVIYTKRSRVDRQTERRFGVEYAALENLLSRAQFVSVHATQGDVAPAIIGPREIALMRSDCVLINTARGNQVDEPALLAALKSGRIRGAALDVFAEEPVMNEELRNLPNVILTPHTAGVMPTGRRFRDAVNNLEAFSKNITPAGLVC